MVVCAFTLAACVTYNKPKAASRCTLVGLLTGLDCSHYLGPFFFLVGDLSEPADPGCCDFLGCASRLVICKAQLTLPLLWYTNYQVLMSWMFVTGGGGGGGRDVSSRIALTSQYCRLVNYIVLKGNAFVILKLNTTQKNWLTPFKILFFSSCCVSGRCSSSEPDEPSES